MIKRGMDLWTPPVWWLLLMGVILTIMTLPIHPVMRDKTRFATRSIIQEKRSITILLPRYRQSSFSMPEASRNAQGMTAVRSNSCALSYPGKDLSASQQNTAVEEYLIPMQVNFRCKGSLLPTGLCRMAVVPYEVS